MRSFRGVRQVRMGEAVLWPQLNRLQCGGRDVRLQPKVVETLVYLARRQGEVVSRSELLDHVWEGTFVKEEAVTTVVSQARRAFGGSAKDSLIETVPKRGYRLIAPVEFISEETSETPEASSSEGDESPPGTPPNAWPAFPHLRGRWRLLPAALASVVLLLAFGAYHSGLHDHTVVVSRAGAPEAGNGQASGPMGAEQLIEQGDHFLQQGTFLANENALSLFLQALREDPESAQANLGLARSLLSRVEHYGYRRSLLDSAVRHAREADRLKPRSGDILRTLGDLERLRGRHDAALEAYLAAGELLPEDGLIAKRVGLLYKRSAALDEALKWLSKARVLLPHDGEIASEIGLIHLSLDQLEKAEMWLLQAIELEPMGAAQRARLTTVYLLQGKWGKAEGPCLTLLAHLPDNVQCLISLGERAAVRGRAEEADQYFQRILVRQPGHPYVRLRRAHLMLQRGRREEAYRLLDQVRASLLRRDDDHWTQFWMMAAISSLKGHPEEAAQWLDRTVEAGRLLFRWDASDPAFLPLKGSPGYQRYLNKMKERAAQLRERSRSPKFTRSFS